SSFIVAFTPGACSLCLTVSRATTYATATISEDDMVANQRLRALGAARRGGDDDFWAPTRAELDRAGLELVLSPFPIPDELLPLARDVDAIFQGPVFMSRELLIELLNLKAICVFGIGVDDFDLEVATNLGIVAINLPRVFHREVAAHAMVLLFALV